jgi:hypothetical protein
MYTEVIATFVETRVMESPFGGTCCVGFMSAIGGIPGVQKRETTSSIGLTQGRFT